MSLKELPQDSSDSPSPEQTARKRPVSERKLQANRRNAVRSTGPTTARGKRNVSRNAIKHGILAREVVVTAGEGEENLKEFHDLVEKLSQQYEAVGVLEESLVQTIATCWWRKARVLRAENGEIRKRLDTAATDQKLRNSDEGNLALARWHVEKLSILRENQADQKVSSTDRWSAMQLSRTHLRGHHSGLAALREVCERAKSEIASEGRISQTVRHEIVDLFFFLDYPFAMPCFIAGMRVKEDGREEKTDGLKKKMESLQTLHTNNTLSNPPHSSV
jgi:hypothetical protein